nr:Arm DNA-binding domain-containing protein [Bacteroides intestinalis]
MKDSASKKEISYIEGIDWRMAVSKDTEKGTWTSQIWVEDFQGKKSLKKHGFASKKEALEWE